MLERIVGAEFDNNGFQIMPAKYSDLIINIPSRSLTSELGLKPSTSMHRLYDQFSEFFTHLGFLLTTSKGELVSECLPSDLSNCIGFDSFFPTEVGPLASVDNFLGHGYYQSMRDRGIPGKELPNEKAGRGLTVRLLNDPETLNNLHGKFVFTPGRGI